MSDDHIERGPMFVQYLPDAENPGHTYILRTQEHIDPDNYKNSWVIQEIYDPRRGRWKEKRLPPHDGRPIMKTLKSQDPRTRGQQP